MSETNSVERLVRPRRESENWLKLGDLLDAIHDAQEHAIHAGFVQGDTRRLDMELERLIKAAQDARTLLRPRATSTKSDWNSGDLMAAMMRDGAGS